MVTVHDKSFEVYIEKTRLEKEIKRVASELMDSYGERQPIFVGVLNGAFMFFSDLMKEFDAPCEVAFLKASSYRGMESTGEVHFKDAELEQLKGRDIVVVEDIVDTGTTLKALFEQIATFEPASMAICTLLLKKEAYKQSIPIDYVCFETENKFLLGYGLDYDGYGRNLPEVYILKD